MHLRTLRDQFHGAIKIIKIATNALLIRPRTSLLYDQRSAIQYFDSLLEGSPEEDEEEARKKVGEETTTRVDYGTAWHGSCNATRADAYKQDGTKAEGRGE